MPKFKVLKDGVNEELMKKAETKVVEYLKQIFEEDEVVEVDGIYSFSFGTASVSIRIQPWHSEDVLVQVYSYVAEEVDLTKELMDELLRMNALQSFGGFGVTFDSTIVFSYALAGANLDYNEFLAAVQTVASVADEYDETIKEMAALV